MKVDNKDILQSGKGRHTSKSYIATKIFSLVSSLICVIDIYEYIYKKSYIFQQWNMSENTKSCM